MIDTLKLILAQIHEDLYYLEESDTAWNREYTKLCKKRRIIKKAIKRLEKLEGTKK